MDYFKRVDYCNFPIVILNAMEVQEICDWRKLIYDKDKCKDCPINKNKKCKKHLFDEIDKLQKEIRDTFGEDKVNLMNNCKA